MIYNGELRLLPPRFALRQQMQLPPLLIPDSVIYCCPQIYSNEREIRNNRSNNKLGKFNSWRM